MSSAIDDYTKKMKLFHTYNLSFCSWAVLALIYYAVTTSKIQCPESNASPI